MLKPLIQWPGGKRKEINNISRYIPQYIEKYIEPFLGGGAIYFNTKAECYFINDISKDLMNFYNTIQKDRVYVTECLNNIVADWLFLGENYSREIDYINKNLKSIKIDKVFYSKLIDKYMKKYGPDKLAIETAVKNSYYDTIRKNFNTKKNIVNSRIVEFIFLRNYSFSGMFRFNNNGDYNVPYGGYRYNNRNLSDLIDKINNSDYIDKFEKSHMYNMDFIDFLNKIKLSEKDFIFLDPPYDSEFSSYDSSNFSKSDHIRIRDYLIGTKSQFLLVILDTPFIREIYANDFFLIEEERYQYTVNIKNRGAKNTKVTHLYITRREKDEIIY